MRLLLDSHIILWWSAGSPKLGNRAQDLLADSDSKLYISAASWWELALKTSLGRLRMDFAVVRENLEKRGVTNIAVTMEHAEAAAGLKQAHRDPFDHMLVAQAVHEGLVMMTRDERLKAYGSHILCV